MTEQSEFFEVVFRLLILIAQLAAVFTVAALVADHVVDPVVRRWQR